MSRNLLVSTACVMLAALAISACGANIATVPLEPTGLNPTVFPTPTATPRPILATPSPTALLTPTRTGSPLPTTQTPASSSSSSSSTRTITLDDSGQTITLQVGERFLLNLGDNWDWQLQIDNPSVLSRVPNILTIKGSQGLFEAHQPGQATLTATGDLPCRKAQPPCMAPSVLFRLQIAIASSANATPSSQNIVTYTDNGQTITVRVGERFLVNLGDSFNWEVSVADPSIVSRLVNIMVIRGAQGVYEAKTTGETTLTATGVAVCSPLKVCPDFEVSFKLHVVVQ